MLEARHRWAGPSLGASAPALLAAVLLAAGCGGGSAATLDEAAFARHLAEETDLDPEQARCVASETFQVLDEEAIATLYEEGLQPLRLSVEGQQYVEILVSCALR